MPPISTENSLLLKQSSLEGNSLKGSTLTSTGNTLLSFSTENKLLNSSKLTSNASASIPAKPLASTTSKRNSLLSSTATRRNLVSNQLLTSAKLLQSSTPLAPLACSSIASPQDRAPNTLLNTSENALKISSSYNAQPPTTIAAELPEIVENSIGNSLPAHVHFVAEEKDAAEEPAEEPAAAFVLEDRKNLSASADDKRSALAAHSLSTKVAFMNAMSGALVCSPKYNDANDAQRKQLLGVASEAVGCDPEFLLKCALYARRDLNIRTASNLLLAYAATVPECRPFLKKYFGTAISLPTDWIEVVELYSTLEESRSTKGRCSLPVALRKAMIEKFADFDIFQLAKYNKEKRPKRGREAKKTGDDSKSTNGRSVTDFRTVPPTLKRLIRQLHISRPADVVMSLTGKRYPASELEFRRSGMLGIWEEGRAGKRMRLPIPETWETQVSKRGNKAEVWEQLLDNKKLPFMAMLRNLRNMIKAGISLRHHNSVLHRLEDERSVISSMQFPFRFFSAYEVLDALKADLARASDIKTKLESKPPKLNVKSKRRNKKEAPKERAAKRARMEKRTQVKYDEAILTRYQKALDTAVKIATLHNIKPIPGRTVVVCYVGDDGVMDAPCTSARGLGKPRTAKEVAALLGLMFKYACEDCQLLVYNGAKLAPVTKLEKGTILDNVKVLINENFVSGVKLGAQLQEYAVDRIKIDNLVVIGNCARQSADDEIITGFFRRYRSAVNSDALYVNVNLAPVEKGGRHSSIPTDDKSSVYLRGFSDQLLRFVAERGNDGLLTYVQNIDKTYELDVAVVGQMSARRQQQLISNIYPSIADIKADRALTVRPVRIFISSTFHDMHGERDELVRSVFPHVQRELSKKTNGTLKICPIDLRWGVSADHVSNQSALEQCLSEVIKCDLFVGVLGARYGWIPSKEQLLHAIKGSPALSWLDDPKILGSELSVTALEVMTYLKQFGNERALFFFRQADYSQIAADKKTFFLESADGMQRIAKLKKYISDAAPQRVHNYRTKGWAVSKGRTICSGLEEFSNTVASQLLNACQPFVSRCLQSKAVNENSQARNWRIVEEKAGCFTSSTVLGHVQSLLNKPSNKLIVLAGESGCGKTSLAADVAIVERNRQRSAVIPCFANTKSLSSAQIIDYLTLAINKIAIELTIDPHLNIAETLTDIAKIGGRVVLVLDGFDSSPSLNSVIADLIVITNVTIVATTGLHSTLYQLATKLGCALVQIPGLPLAARKTMVRKELSEFGKRLGESAFDSQIRSFVSKRQADKPSYIKLACHYLRLFAYFDNIGTMISKLPPTIESLVREIVKQLELNCGRDLIGSLLGYLLVSPGPLTENDLHQLASAAAQNNASQGFAGLLPRYHFQRTFNLMQILLNEDVDGSLTLTNSATCDVVTKTYLKTLATRKMMLSSLADFCNGMLETASIEEFARYAKVCMNCRVMIADWTALHDLLRRIEYLEKSVESNMIDALEAFAETAIEGLDAGGKKGKSKNANNITMSDLRAVKRFIGEKKEFLKRYPKLLIQELANYPEGGGVSDIIHSNVATDQVIQWQNKPDQASKCLRTVKYGDTAVTAATVSLNGAILAFGDEDGVVRIVKYDSAEIVHTFPGHSQRVTDLCFVDGVGRTLVSASKDSSLIVWDTVACARLATLKHGDSVVSACRYFEWSKCLLSAGWNGEVRAFAPVMGQWKTASVLDRELSVGSAINCLDCHPTRPVIIVGCWDATLKLYQLAPVKRLAVMRGHESAVRTVQFVAMGKQIISTGMDGDIRVWATDHGVQVGTFAGHTLPVRAMAPLAGDIVTVSEDTTIKVWSSSLGVSLFRQSVEDKATSISLSPDGSLLAVGFGSCAISVYKTRSTDQCAWTRRVDAAVVSVRFFGQLLLVAYKSGGEVFRATNGELVARLTTGDPDLMCADAGGSYVVTGHASGAIKVFETSLTVGWKQSKSGVQPWTEKFEHEDAVTCCALSPKALRLATVGRDKKLIIWEMSELLERKSGECAQSVVRECHNDWVLSCAWSDSADALVVTGGLDCAVKVWDAKKGCALIGTYTHHSAAVLSVVFQKKVIASTDSDGSVCVVSAKNGALVTRMKPTADGAMPVACAFRIGNPTYDDASQPNPNDRIDWAAEVDAAMERENENLSGKITTVQNALLRDSQLAVAFDSGSFQIYNPFMGDEKSCATGHSAPVLCVASVTNCSGDSFVTGDKNGLCKWWSELTVESEATTRLSGAITAMSAVSGCVVAGCRDGSLHVIDRKGSKVASWKAHTRTVTGLVNLSDNRLASVSEDQTVAVWALKEKSWDATEVSRTQFDAPIACAVFNDQLLVATWDNKIQMIDPFSGVKLRIVRPLSDAFVERSVLCHQGNAAFLSSDGDVAGQWLEGDEVKISVMLLRGASCAVELFPKQWIVGTKVGEIIAYNGNGTTVQLCKAHDANIIGIIIIPNREGKPSALCSVSQDCTVKIWNIELNETIALNLIGCWLAPVEPNYVIFCETSGEIWIGDTVGTVYRLKFGSM